MLNKKMINLFTNNYITSKVNQNLLLLTCILTIPISCISTVPHLNQDELGTMIDKARKYLVENYHCLSREEITFITSEKPAKFSYYLIAGKYGGDFNFQWKFTNGNTVEIKFTGGIAVPEISSVQIKYEMYYIQP